MVEKIQTDYPDLYAFQLPPQGSVVDMDQPILLQNMFDQLGQQETLKAYRRYLCQFIIFVLFYKRRARQVPDGPDGQLTPDDPDAPLLTFSNCAAFLALYKDRNKRYTLRGDNGSEVASLTMINQLQMVLNGFYMRERNTFQTHLKSKKFKDSSHYFNEHIEMGKPASKHNLSWKQLLGKHGRTTAAEVDSSGVHNAEGLKAVARISDEEYWQIVHNCLQQDRLAAYRDAAMLTVEYSAIARCGDIRSAQFRDITHGRGSVGQAYDVYESLRTGGDSG
jgi:hypothetical protein